MTWSEGKKKVKKKNKKNKGPLEGPVLSFALAGRTVYLIRYSADNPALLPANLC